MKIIIDTNIINKDYKLSGRFIVTLSEAAVKLGYEVCVPEVVIDEIEDHYKTDLSAAYDKYSKGYAELNTLLPNPLKPIVQDIFIAQKLNEFRCQYEACLHDRKIKILPYPRVEHKEIVAKELRKRKPFKDSKKGYRDSLIWETVKAELVPIKELFQECQIIFITKNTKDFADANGLHQDLIDELLDLGYGDNVIKLVTDSDEFLKSIINPQFEELKAIKEVLNSKGSYNRVSIEDDVLPMFTVQFVEHIVDQVDEYGISTYLPLYCESPYVESIDEPVVAVDSVIRLSDGKVMIGCNAHIRSEISYYIDRANYAAAVDYVNPYVLNYEHNPHYLEVSNLIDLTLEVHITATQKLSKIISTEIIPKSICMVPYE